MTKKIISIVLAAVMLISVLSVAVIAASAEENGNSGVSLTDGRKNVSDLNVATNRYYFYMPKSWYNEYTQTAGVYWWGGDNIAAPEKWPGYFAYEGEYKSVFYADVPAANVSGVIFNNGVDGGTDPEQDIFTKSNKTMDIQYFDLPFLAPLADGLSIDALKVDANGQPTFNEMIFVVDEDQELATDPLSAKPGYQGHWYFYYGDGTCGVTPEKTDNYIVLSTEQTGNIVAPPASVGEATPDQKPTDANKKPTDATSTIGKTNGNAIKTGSVVAAAVLMVVVVMGTVCAGVVVSRKKKQQ